MMKVRTALEALLFGIAIVIFSSPSSNAEDYFYGSTSGVASQYNGANVMPINPSTTDFLFQTLLAGDDSPMAECVSSNPTFTQLMMSTDPLNAAYKVMYKYCGDNEQEAFQQALQGFQECSEINMKTFIETIGGAMIGVVMHCGKYVFDLTAQYDMMTMPAFPLPRIPDQCIQAIIGDNPFGNMVRYYSEHPDHDNTCFLALSKSLPDCTLNEWPIPIVGSLLQSFSCVYGNMQMLIESICKSELEILGRCLDGILEEETPDCNSWITQCAVQGFDEEAGASWHMMLPPPLLGMPLSDACSQMAGQDNFFSSGASNYQRFVEQCVSQDDAAAWLVEPSKWDVPIQPLYTKPTTTGTKASKSPQGQTDTAAMQATMAANSATGGSNSGGRNTFSTLVIGMLTGALVLILGLYAYGKIQTQSSTSYTSRRLDGHSGTTNVYNDLELTDSMTAPIT